MLVADIEFDIVLLGRRKRVNQTQAIESAAPAGALPYDRLKSHFREEFSSILDTRDVVTIPGHVYHFHRFAPDFSNRELSVPA